nr:GlsB/YeaQ/YmgE family stress response membrane protein [Bacteriovorax sp. HI3]
MTMRIVFWTIMIGFMSGAVIKVCMPKIPHGSVFTTMTIGLIGSVFFGWLGSRFGLYEYGDMEGLIASFIGAVSLLYIFYSYVAAFGLKHMKKRPKFRHP